MHFISQLCALCRELQVRSVYSKFERIKGMSKEVAPQLYAYLQVGGEREGKEHMSAWVPHTGPCNGALLASFFTRFTCTLACDLCVAGDRQEWDAWQLRLPLV